MIPAFLSMILAGTLGLPQVAPRNIEEEPDCVVLLHGLGRTAASMRVMASALEERGYRVVNQDYPSRAATVEKLADITLPEAIAACGESGRINFVTHSMGGILLNQWLAEHPLERAGRAVMLGPPGGGSEIVDRFEDWRIFEAINGPAGLQLGTGPGSVPNLLPKEASIETGVIAGTFSMNPFYSALIEGPNDGKVSVRSALATPAQDSLVLNVSHTWMMMNPKVIAACLTFLETGRFGGRG